MAPRTTQPSIRPRDLPLLAVFAAVARAGSFTRAATQLGVAKSVVSEQVRSLEEKCGARLLERTSRRLQLTQLGEHLLSTAALVADAAHTVDAILADQRDAIVGTLRIATTSDLSTRLVVPAAARVAATSPRLSLDIVGRDSTEDLLEGRFDVAIRLGTPKSSSLTMRKLGVMREIIVATPGLAGLHPAKRPSELEGAPWVRHALLPDASVWRFNGPRGEREPVPVRVRAQTNTGEGLRALALEGLGFSVLPSYLVAEDVKRGALTHVCPSWHLRDLILFALLPSKKAPRRVTAFLDALQMQLAEFPLAPPTIHKA
jgi:DNA-binding transcriptional LysR family regulator